MSNLHAIPSPQQRSPGDAPAQFVPCLASVAKSVRQFLGIKFAPHGVVVGQEQLLLCLLEKETVSVAEAAKALAVRPSTISKMVDICDRKGWMYRRADQSDNRRVLLSLTEDGRTVAGIIQTVVAEIEQELADLFAGDETVLPVLQTLDGLLVKRLSRLR